MKIWMLNVNQFRTLHFSAGCWAKEIVAYVKGFLCGGRENAVVLHEIPKRDSGDVFRSFLKEFEGYDVFLTKRPKTAYFYTLAITNQAAGWSGQVEDEDQADGDWFRLWQEKGTMVWVNRFVEIVHSSGLRVLGLHAPLEDSYKPEDIERFYIRSCGSTPRSTPIKRPSFSVT